MAQSTNLDNAGMQRLPVPDWGEGIITSRPATEIPDNAAQDILNMEHDDSNNLGSRAGCSALFDDTYAGRITSLHYFRAESGEVGLLYTSGTSLYLGQTDGSGVSDITGLLTLPSDTFWQWKTFQNLAIGVNKATAGDNPVKVSDAGVAAALGGSPPKAKYAEVWNSRLWLASATDPNTLWGSELGDPEGWATMSAGGAEAASFEIEPGDGDQITGLYATRSTLYIFKRRRIYRMALIDPSKSANDITNLAVELYAQNIGCVSAYSIQAVLDDVVFLSELGVSSLTLAEGYEGFKTSQFSEKIAEIARTPKITEEIPAIVVDTVAQYWLSLPSTISLTLAPQVYVLDYQRAPEKVLRWTRFDGAVAGTAFTTWVDDIGKVFIVGALNADGDYQIFKYRPRDYTFAFSDAGAAYTKMIKTKAFTVGAPLIRKHWQMWAASLGLLSDSATFQLQYYFDGNLSKGGAYSFNLTAPGGGARWDSAIWDTSLWDSAVLVSQDIVRRILANSSGQRGQNITFIMQNAQVNEGISLLDFDLYWTPLNEKGVTEV